MPFGNQEVTRNGAFGSSARISYLIAPYLGECRLWRYNLGMLLSRKLVSWHRLSLLLFPLCDAAVMSLFNIVVAVQKYGVCHGWHCQAACPANKGGCMSTACLASFAHTISSVSAAAWWCFVDERLVGAACVHVCARQLSQKLVQHT